MQIHICQWNQFYYWEQSHFKQHVDCNHESTHFHHLVSQRLCLKFHARTLFLKWFCLEHFLGCGPKILPYPMCITKFQALLHTLQLQYLLSKDHAHFLHNALQVYLRYKRFRFVAFIMDPYCYLLNALLQLARQLITNLLIFQLVISGNKIFFNYMDHECWMVNTLWCLIYCVGCYHLAKFVFALGWSLARWMTTKIDVRKKYGGEGCWAVVTGGTDGIGLGFVEVLVEDGWNVCIVSRNEQKINTLINRMNQLNPKVSCLAVTADFKHSSEPYFIPNIINKIKHLDIGLVINNVGTSYLQPLLQNTITQCIDIVNVNCTSMAAFTCAILPHLKKREKRSGIINLSSFICAVPTPYTSLYSGTKAFNHWFSLCLSEEIATHQIDVLSVKPMYVESPLSKEKAGGTVATREQFARAALKELYLGVRESQGWILHRILASIIAIIPPPIARLIANTIANSKIKWFNKKY